MNDGRIKVNPSVVISSAVMMLQRAIWFLLAKISYRQDSSTHLIVAVMNQNPGSRALHGTQQHSHDTTERSETDRDIAKQSDLSALLCKQPPK